MTLDIQQNAFSFQEGWHGLITDLQYYALFRNDKDWILVILAWKECSVMKKAEKSIAYLWNDPKSESIWLRKKKPTGKRSWRQKRHLKI